MTASRASYCSGGPAPPVRLHALPAAMGALRLAVELHCNPHMHTTLALDLLHAPGECAAMSAPEGYLMRQALGAWSCRRGRWSGRGSLRCPSALAQPSRTVCCRCDFFWASSASQCNSPSLYVDQAEWVHNSCAPAFLPHLCLGYVSSRPVRYLLSSRLKRWCCSITLASDL